MKKQLLLVVAAIVYISSNSFAGSQDKFFEACMQCDLEAVKKYVEKGADPKAMHSSKQNALSLSYFCPEVTKYLIEQGVDPMSDGGGALVGAANNYSVEVMKLLLDAGADPNAVSPIYGADAVTQTLRQTNCVPCLEMLVEKGGDLTKVDANGNTALHTIAMFGMTADERKALFKAGKKGMEGYGLKVPDWYGNLGPDRNGSNEAMIDIVLKAGVDISAKNKQHYSPLMLAAGGLVQGKMGKFFIAKTLIKKGANVDNNTPDGLTIKQLAKNSGDKELLDLVEEALKK